jgi:hypothetical protein
VSPDPIGPIEPFLRNASNQDADIRAMVIDNPQTFGLADDFVVSV